MEREIIVLTKSSKHNNYCIAGVDTTTGEWIRPISTNVALEGAVLSNDIIYKNGSSVQVLDKVKVSFISHSPTLAQPENYIYDSSKYWIKTGSVTLDELIGIRGYDQPDIIFYNYDKDVSEKVIGGQPSLLFVEVRNSRIFIKTFENSRRIQFNFSYNGVGYSFFKISDEAVQKSFSDFPDGSYNHRDTLPVVFSLTDKYTVTNKYYKMAAQLFY